MEYDQPLDLSLPKKTNDVTTRKIKREKTNSLYKDIELVLPSSKTNLEKLGTLRSVDTSKPVPLSADTHGLHTTPSENDIQSIAAEESDLDKSIDSVEGTVSSSTGSVSHCVDYDDDDECSVVSMDTPSLSGIDDELSLDEEVDAIFAQTIKNSPKMISPIKDLPKKRRRQLNYYQEWQQTKWKSSATESDGTAEFFNSDKRPQFGTSSSKETAELIQPEHSNEQLENIVGNFHRIDTSEPLTHRTSYKSKIDFKELTINVGNRNSTRTVSLSDANPTVMVTHVQPVSQTVPIPYNDRLHKIPVQSTVNVHTLNATRTALLTNANPTAMVTHSQSALPAAQVPNNDRMHIVPVQSTLNVVGGLRSNRTASLTNANPTALVTHSQSALPAAQVPYNDRMHIVPVQSTLNVGGGLRSNRTASLTNANPTAMVTHSQSALPAAQLPYNERMHIVPVQSTLNVGGGLKSNRTASSTNANPTALVTHSQSALPAAQVQCNERIHKVPALLRFQPSPPLSSTQPVRIVQPMDSVRGNLNTPTPDWRPDYSLSPDQRRRYNSAGMKLFENPCINFLAGKPCIEPDSCPYYHQLPATDKVLEKMKTYPDTKIHFIYTSFILKTIMAFSQYFPMICYLFGIRKMKEALVSSVDRCNAFKRYDFYRFIFGGLLMCGMPNWEALQIFDDFADICEESVAALIEIGKNPSNPFLS